MPRPGLNSFWINNIYVIYRNNLKSSAVTVRNKLLEQLESKKVVLRVGVGGMPVERTIRKYMAKFSELPESEQRQYEWFEWPDICRRELMPWESSKSILDLLVFKNEKGMQPPTLAEFEWLWRVVQARPDIKISDGVKAALLLAEIEESGNPSIGAERTIMWALAYKAKKSPAHLTRYDDALRAGRIPPMEGTSVPSQLLGDVLATRPFGRNR